MKIPFDIKFRDKIGSGAYKVIDKFGYVLTLKDIINDVWYFSLRYPNTDYETERIYDHPENHLFIVTPEKELSEFEEEVRSWMSAAENLEIDNSWVKNCAKILLSSARKELHENMKEALRTEYKKERADVLKDLPRWEKREYAPQNANIYLPTNELVYHGMAISIDELTKLPGFKEDESNE